MKAKSTKKADILQLRLNITKGGLKELRELQQLLGADSLTEVIRSSVKLLRYLKQEQIKGAHIIIHKEGVKDRELIYNE